MIFRVAIALLDQHKYELMKRDNFEEIMDYMKNIIPQIDAETLDKVMRDVFTTDIQKQLTEYQVEYNVLQEEISTTQHYMESLNREKESYAQIESKLQVKYILSKRTTSNTNEMKDKKKKITYTCLSSTFSFIFFNFSVCRIEYCSIGENPFVTTITNSIIANASAKFGNIRRNVGSIYVEFI